MDFRKIMLSVGGVIASIGTATATYVGNYTTNDLPKVAIDTGGHFLANIVTYVALIALMGIALFLWKRARGLGKVFVFFLLGVGAMISGIQTASATYSETYTASDYSSIVVDFVGNYLVQIISFVGLIVLVVLLAWFMKQGKHLGK